MANLKRLWVLWNRDNRRYRARDGHHSEYTGAILKAKVFKNEADARAAAKPEERAEGWRGIGALR